MIILAGKGVNNRASNARAGDKRQNGKDGRHHKEEKESLLKKSPLSFFFFSSKKLSPEALSTPLKIG